MILARRRSWAVLVRGAAGLALAAAPGCRLIAGLPEETTPFQVMQMDIETMIPVAAEGAELCVDPGGPCAVVDASGVASLEVDLSEDLQLRAHRDDVLDTLVAVSAGAEAVDDDVVMVFGRETLDALLLMVGQTFDPERAILGVGVRGDPGGMMAGATLSSDAVPEWIYMDDLGMPAGGQAATSTSGLAVANALDGEELSFSVGGAASGCAPVWAWSDGPGAFRVPLQVNAVSMAIVACDAP